MYKFKILLLLLCLLTAGLSGCSNVSPSTSGKEKILLKLGTDTALDSPETRGAQRLADLVKEKSKGTLEIQVYENAKLANMRDRNENMRMGTTDMGTSSVGFLSVYQPLLGIFDLPYLYQDKAHEFRVFDSPIGQEINRKLQEEGLRALCYFDAGTRQITNNRLPIRTAADLKGLRIRVPQNKASIEGFKTLDTLPLPLPFGEVYSALQQGTAEGQENPLSLIFHNKFYEVQKYLSITNHQMFIQVLLISEKTWQKLSPQHRDILLEAAKEAQSYQRSLAAKEEFELLNQLKEKGMEINQVANPQEFAAKTYPLREVYSKRLGQQAQSLFERIDALRQ